MDRQERKQFVCVFKFGPLSALSVCVEFGDATGAAKWMGFHNTSGAQLPIMFQCHYTVFKNTS